MPKASPFDPELVRELAMLIAQTDLTEIEVEKGDLRIRVARTVTMSVNAPVLSAVPAEAQPTPMLAATAPSVPPPPAPTSAKDHPGALLSPMVGTAYRRPSPESKPFVEIGSRVEAGDKVLLVEAMKTYNDIVAPRAGVVSAVFVEDGQPVEYGEPLLVIE